ncbi:hypothetical protein FQA39_LY17229 [Lamprigera yunnana]|nr:hypothetical protein FQA39_LY17229 [Lamprigera yunnana]
MTFYEFPSRSQEFQQDMFEKLGDRDYNSFELDEHCYLKNKIGFAKFGVPGGKEYDVKQNKIINKTFNIIRKENNKFAERNDYIVISFIFNCLEPLSEDILKKFKKNPNYDPIVDSVFIPIFVLQKCIKSSNACRIFVDHNDRVYSSWENYKQNNRLHKCIMVLPKDGLYQGDENNIVQLETIRSPSCSISNTILNKADRSFSVAGIVSGAVLLGAVIPAITIAPIALMAATACSAGAGVYGIIRGGDKLVDRIVHKETMRITDYEARTTYLNIIAGTLSFAGAAANKTIYQLASKGYNISRGGKIAVNMLNMTNLGVSGTSVLSSSYELVQSLKQKKISFEEIIQLTFAIAFFHNAVYNFQTANSIISEAQGNFFQRHLELLSKGQRKGFRRKLNKLLRDGIEAQTARAKVIAKILEAPSSILMRNKNLLDKEGFKLSENYQQITLNDVTINIIDIGMKSYKSPLIDSLFTDLKLGENLISLSKIIMKRILSLKTLDEMRESGGSVIFETVLTWFSEIQQENILKILKAFFEDKNGITLENKFTECKPVNNWYVKVLKYLFEFLSLKAENFENQDIKIAIDIIGEFVNNIVSGHDVFNSALKAFTKYVTEKILRKKWKTFQNCKPNFNEQSNIIQNSQQNQDQQYKTQVSCSTCNGYFFT